jgi:hypothetical protein
MADELDAQEPEVQETPTAEEVPQQALFEPRNVAEAMELPDPQPTAEAPPAPEPEAPVVEPDWLNPQPEPELPAQPPQYPTAPPDYYQEPQYPQQPQAPPARTGDAALEAFVDNPQAWLDQQLAAREQQLLGPIQQNLQSVAYVQQQIMESNVRQNVAKADQAIRSAYDVFNKDSAFRTNEEMQKRVGGTLQGMRENAIAQARAGNFGPMESLINLDEGAIRGTLAFLREQAGVQSPGTGPLQIEGATVESSRAPVAEQGVELSAEQEEIARRMGPGYRARMVEAIKDQQKYDDLEWKE